MTMILGILGLLGGFVALFTLGWRILDARRAYLHIGLTVEEITGRAFKLRTIVENKDFFARKIDGAFLMIGPLWLAFGRRTGNPIAFLTTRCSPERFQA